MAAKQLSSGDVIADRRADYARMLAESGDVAAAADLMEQALELTPDWAAGWFALSTFCEKAGDRAGAVAALQKVLSLSQEDIFGAELKLAVLGAVETPDQPPTAYVEQLFDDYADRFEQSLLEKLDYSVPQKLNALLQSEIVPGRSFRLIVDLGCGTGLMAQEIGSRAERLEGFDLSLGMLAKAEAKALYHHLAQADLSLPPEESGIFSPTLPQNRADLVTAADVLMYVGALESTFMIVDRLLAPGGFFAFSVEEGKGEDFTLMPSLRYAHSNAYVRRLCEAFVLDVRALQVSTIRMDGGRPVSGILFLAQKGG